MASKNWRGVTLLVIADKIFYKILLNRMQNILDTVFRKEQSGFRWGKGYRDSVLILKT